MTYPRAYWTSTSSGGSPKRWSPGPPSPRSPPTPKTAGARPTSGAPGPTAEPVGEAATGRAVRDVASPRVRHQLHPVRGRVRLGVPPLAGEVHRDHAIIEQVIAELKDGPLAHAPFGKFGANAV